MLLFRITSVITLREAKPPMSTNQGLMHTHAKLGGFDSERERGEGGILAEGGDPLALGLPAAVGRGRAPARLDRAAAAGPRALVLLRLPLLRHLRQPCLAPIAASPRLASLVAT